MDAEIDGGEEAVCHEDDVSAMGVGDYDVPFGVKEGDVALDHKRQPAGIGAIPDLMFVSFVVGCPVQFVRRGLEE